MIKRKKIFIFVGGLWPGEKQFNNPHSAQMWKQVNVALSQQ